MNPTTKKRTGIAATVLVLVAGSGVAYAYWTNSGTGSGSATTGTNAALTVNQTSTVTAMAPGVAAQPLSGNFDNPNAGPVFIKTVAATVTARGWPAAPPPTTPSAGTSIIGSAAPGAGDSVPAGTSVGSWSGLSIAFNNTASNQDACKGAVSHHRLHDDRELTPARRQPLTGRRRAP